MQSTVTTITIGTIATQTETYEAKNNIDIHQPQHSHPYTNIYQFKISA